MTSWNYDRHIITLLRLDNYYLCSDATDITNIIFKLIVCCSLDFSVFLGTEAGVGVRLFLDDEQQALMGLISCVEENEEECSGYVDFLQYYALIMKIRIKKLKHDNAKTWVNHYI
ncbi:hypothetical protein JTB14_002429 [Gonioctena quinquepunctata]|nr:hypothetical protein JTB14_002429 [Gonioctena quinquepunctata]